MQIFKQGINNMMTRAFAESVKSLAELKSVMFSLRTEIGLSDTSGVEVIGRDSKPQISSISDK
jgi:hypothetical protein